MKQRITLIILALVLSACGADYSQCDYSEEMVSECPLIGDDMFAPLPGGEFSQVKLGSLVEVSATDVIVPGTGSGKTQTLLDENLNDYPTMREGVLEPGCWVLTFQTEILAQSSLPTPGINPLYARLEYGSGGVSVTADIDISPGASVQISADRIRADIRLESFINYDTVLGPSAFVPELQRVKAVLRRGYATTVPTRSFYVYNMAQLTTVVRDLPPLAVDVFGHAGLPTGLAVTNTLYDPDTIFELLGGSVALATFTGTDLYNSQRSGNPLPVPQGANRWRITSPNTVEGIGAPFSIEFGLDL